MTPSGVWRKVKRVAGGTRVEGGGGGGGGWGVMFLIQSAEKVIR